MTVAAKKRAHLTHANNLYYGGANVKPLHSTNQRNGVRFDPTVKVHLGTPVALSATGLCVAITSTNLPNNATKTYTTANATTPLGTALVPTLINSDVANFVSAFPLRGATVTDGNFVEGKAYTIVSLGTTDFTKVGALNPAVGSQFIATKNGTVTSATINTMTYGTGTAYEVVSRNITVATTAAVAAFTVTIRGFDQYLKAMTEVLTVGAAGTSGTGKKAFAYVSSIAIASAGDITTNSVSIGWGNAIGLPYVITSKSDLVQAWLNDSPDSAWPTVVIADSLPATGTTGDVRGTILFGTALSGSASAKALVITDPNTITTLAGVDQFKG